VLISPLAIAGAFEIATTVHGDSRGEFVEWFRAEEFKHLYGHDFSLAQANLSRSAKGALRGIHFADVPPGQAKCITCPYGRMLDFIIDIRVGSPTFGQWASVELSGENRNAVFIAEGLGHAFLSLEDNTVVTYLVSDVYRPEREHGVNPLDSDIGLEFPIPSTELQLSEKDQIAPGLFQAQEMGLLPIWSGEGVS
jgi:dTDP-4-dehydrorhamnose 3,5-epimerase